MKFRCVAAPACTLLSLALLRFHNIACDHAHIRPLLSTSSRPSSEGLPVCTNLHQERLCLLPPLPHLCCTAFPGTRTFHCLFLYVLPVCSGLLPRSLHPRRPTLSHSVIHRLSPRCRSFLASVLAVLALLLGQHPLVPLFGHRSTRLTLLKRHAAALCTFRLFPRQALHHGPPAGRRTHQERLGFRPACRNRRSALGSSFGTHGGLFTSGFPLCGRGLLRPLHPGCSATTHRCIGLLSPGGGCHLSGVLTLLCLL